jgi:hypothetical protein
LADRLFEVHPVDDVLRGLGGGQPQVCPPVMIAPKAVLCVHACGDGSAMIELASRGMPQLHVKESARRIGRLLRRASNGRRDPEPVVREAAEIPEGPPAHETPAPVAHPGTAGVGTVRVP